MNQYRPEVPRAAFALGAVAMTVFTIAALVVAPAKLDSGFGPNEFARAPSAPAAPVEVAINPASIHVIGVRAPNVAWALPDASKPCKPEV